MNKFDILSVPNDLDLANPYKINSVSNTDITKVTYTGSGMTLTNGQWTFDTDELAYWICPKITTGVTRGYIKLIDDEIIVQAGDDIEAEFEIKFMDTVTGQNVGVRTDILTSSLSLIGSLDFFDFTYSKEYVSVNIKRRILPSYTTANKLNLVFGTLTSSEAASPYSFKIRNIKININRNSIYLNKPTRFIDYGLGIGNFSNDKLIDHITTYPTSQARDVSLKQGVYGFQGSGTANGSLTGNGVLLVYPYRADGVGGSNYTKQLVIINAADTHAGMWERSYNGSNSTWSTWARIMTSNVGNTASRPASAFTGYQYYDTTLSKPIWWNGTVWKDAAGTTV